uniref:Uncharacterized protein n=1 Tax=Lactuca sativa TaxID=4236 RepID=A0A9R1X043_LACSA|nr:hypothetical protein LSAT_V11C800398990 [Lactuca sativa]
MLLIYCDEIECKLQKIEHKTPLVTMWTTDKLKERQSFEIKAGGFGVGNLIEQSSNLERDKNENQENENQDTPITIQIPSCIDFRKLRVTSVTPLMVHKHQEQEDEEER